ncbi:MAG: hypothetical protein IIA85_00935 [Nanoarchaeota archaeon]|nr:hypothetical protein [Nanoarchaeota archaeon]
MKPKICYRIPFRINYPLNILDESKKINFSDKKERENLFKRNLFYYRFGRTKNTFLKERHKTYLFLAKKISKFIRRKHPNLEILNISVFGSSLYSANPSDFDFLVVVKGNIFLLEEAKLTLRENGKVVNFPVGISIKGLDNFTFGILDLKNKTSLEQQNQIIDRTVISLFKRHLPVIGCDFIENKDIFKDNTYAQVSDLLANTYNLYYLKKEKLYLTDKQRASKILSRLYEAVSYLEFLEKDSHIINLKQEIYNYYNKKDLSFSESKLVFNKFKLLFINRSKKLKEQILKEINFSENEREFLNILKKTKELLYKRKIGKFLPVMTKIIDGKRKVIAFSKRIKHENRPIHAEICAINDSKRNGKNDWRDYTLYCSLEPCGECANEITKLGIKKVVYCLVDPLFSHYGGKRNNYGNKNRLFYRHNSPKLIAEFQKLYSELYKKKINLIDTSKILDVLSKDKLRKNITQRLVKYWRAIKLPYQWITPILKILLEHKDNEDLAVRKIRDKFPQLIQKGSPEYSKKLIAWRKRKVKNLARNLNKYLAGKIIADVGGRATDFAEQIISFNKKIKKVYVTDIGLFATRSKNHKINLLVQPSKTMLPFNKESIDTIILSMVIHHLRNFDQIKLIKNITFSLMKKGRIILIEDTYLKNKNIKGQGKNINDFLKFSLEEKKKILSFYDFFGNRLMRNRDKIPLLYNYKSMEEWKTFFEKYGMKQIKSEFVKEEKLNLALFPPKGVMVFEKQENIKTKN